jgi:endonuclease YncB( thermonuclease family)
MSASARSLSGLAAILLLASLPQGTAAETMPPPQKAPRTPVAIEKLKGPDDNHSFTGTAFAIDGERMRLGDREIRLFGIVAPSLSSIMGPTARQALDQLLTGKTVSCQTRDRDREGRPLVQCTTDTTPDLALALVKDGYAVVARGSLAATDLAVPYDQAEKEASGSHKGMWGPLVGGASHPGGTAVAEPAAKPAPAQAAPAQAAPATPTSSSAPVAAATPSVVAPSAAPSLAPSLPPIFTQPAVPPAESGAGWVERYQNLLAGLLALLAALLLFRATIRSQTTALMQVTLDKMETRKSVAAALRGELMAARSLCRTRADALTAAGQPGGLKPPPPLWPRIRTLVFQAYVGQIGLLGADLARQIASLYGQLSDHGALHHAPRTGLGLKADLHDPTRIAETLTQLAAYADVAIERLEQVETTGLPFTAPPIPTDVLQSFTAPDGNATAA